MILKRLSKYYRLALQIVSEIYFVRKDRSDVSLRLGSHSFKNEGERLNLCRPRRSSFHCASVPCLSQNQVC